MSVQAHVKALTDKHAEIEQIITHEEHRPNPDSIRLSQLKRKKLRLKEQMAKYRIEH